MRPFQHGLAIGSDPREVVNVCLAQIGDIEPATNVGFLYLTDALASELEHILHLLQQGTGIQHWYGSTGIALIGREQEIYDQPALSILLASLPADGFRTLGSIRAARDGDRWLAAHEAWLETSGARFGIVHGDPTNPAIPTLIEKLADALDGGFFCGGLTSSQTQYLQVADQITDGGLSGVLLAPEAEVVVGHTQGCSPIGPVRTITEAAANIVMEIDGMSALEAMRQDVGEVLARDLSRLGGFIFAGLPIRGSDTGDYMIRNLLGIDQQAGRIAIGDRIEPGDQIVFCRRDGNTARDDMQRMLDDLKRRCDGRRPRGGIYVSCLGRGRHQFGEQSQEIGMITATLGDMPLTGFFASGEIFHDRIYGYTGVLTLFL